MRNDKGFREDFFLSLVCFGHGKMNGIMQMGYKTKRPPRLEASSMLFLTDCFKNQNETFYKRV
jgi:hypothetical protein